MFTALKIQYLQLYSPWNILKQLEEKEQNIHASEGFFLWLQTEAAGSECQHWETRWLVGSASEVQRPRPGQGDDRL